MTANPGTRLRRLTVALAVLPLAVACHGGDGGSGGPRADGMLGAVDSGSTVVITTDNGVRLRPADGRSVSVDGDVGAHWSHHDDMEVLDLSCDEQDREGRPCPRMPTVEVPDDVRVTVTARNAGVDVVGIAAALDVTTVNGDVTVARSGRDDAAVKLTTRNGSVRATAVAADRLYAVTSNGDAVLACATAASRVTGRTTNGSVDVTVPDDAPAYRVTATTRNGQPRITVPTRTAGDGPAMTLSTVNGDVAAHRE
ncbi:DUF4097 family beta strand repeat-containing protein [Streptomyces longwoodensis]|uniref:DUF4097 family beta strand repeat-containing protein n=1 Tax=Streptomyces longwoodensis TaxID=68231 RepID=UPI00340F532E